MIPRPPAKRAVTALITGHTLSRTGNVITVFAIPFAVLDAGGDAVSVGLASAAATAPVILGGPLGGALLDRIGYVRSSVLADVMSGLTIAVIPLLAVLGALPFPLFLALVFLGGLLDAPGETARRVLLPQLSSASGIRIERSVGFTDGATRASALVGAPLAAAAIAAFGVFPALLMTAALFAISATITVAGVRGVPIEQADPGVGQGYWRDLRNGLRFVVRDPLLRRLTALVLTTNALDAARSGALLPLYAAERLDGPPSLGLIVAAFGGAALAGSVLFGFVAHRFPRRVTFVVCFAIAGSSALAPALGASTPWLVGCYAVAGLAAGALNPIIGAVQLERIPLEYRGRVFGLTTAGAWAGMPFGAMLGGIGAATIGLTASFAALFAVYLAATLTPLAGGPWRQMERDPH